MLPDASSGSLLERPPIDFGVKGFVRRRSDRWQWQGTCMEIEPDATIFQVPL